MRSIETHSGLNCSALPSLNSSQNEVVSPLTRRLFTCLRGERALESVGRESEKTHFRGLVALHDAMFMFAMQRAPSQTHDFSLLSSRRNTQIQKLQAERDDKEKEAKLFERKKVMEFIEGHHGFSKKVQIEKWLKEGYIPV